MTQLHSNIYTFATVQSERYHQMSQPLTTYFPHIWNRYRSWNYGVKHARHALNWCTPKNAHTRAFWVTVYTIHHRNVQCISWQVRVKYTVRILMSVIFTVLWLCGPFGVWTRRALLLILVHKMHKLVRYSKMHRPSTSMAFLLNSANRGAEEFLLR